MSANLVTMNGINELREHYKRKFNITDEEWNALVQSEAENSIINKNIVLLQGENADLWYDAMLKDMKLEAHDKEIADVWYEVMIGGM